MFYDEGRFAPGGFVHFDCSKAYSETKDVLPQIDHFSFAPSDEEREALRRARGSRP